MHHHHHPWRHLGPWQKLSRNAVFPGQCLCQVDLWSHVLRHPRTWQHGFLWNSVSTRPNDVKLFSSWLENNNDGKQELFQLNSFYKLPSLEPLFFVLKNKGTQRNAQEETLEYNVTQITTRSSNEAKWLPLSLSPTCVRTRKTPVKVLVYRKWTCFSFHKIEWRTHSIPFKNNFKSVLSVHHI